MGTVVGNLFDCGQTGREPEQGPGLMIAVTAHLSFAGEHDCDEPHDEASRPHMISHPVEAVEFFSVILACLAKAVLVLLHLLF